jgi:hypothetical protein
MTKKVEYNIDFYQALKLMVEEKKWFRGENFAKGMYIKLNNDGEIISVDMMNWYEEYPMPFIDSLARQKYREITIATLNELSI